jgi:hypothetical protein
MQSIRSGNWRSRTKTRLRQGKHSETDWRAAQRSANELDVAANRGHHVPDSEGEGNKVVKILSYYAGGSGDAKGNAGFVPTPRVEPVDDPTTFYRMTEARDFKSLKFEIDFDTRKKS